MKLKVFASVCVLVLASLACAVPDVGSLFNPLPKDDFSDSNSGWGTGTDSYSSVEYADGGLKMQVFEPLYMAGANLGRTFHENTHIEVDVTSTSADVEALYGIICNAQAAPSSYYFVGVTDGGDYAFVTSSIMGSIEVIKQGTSSVISAANGSMRLGLDCGTNSMTLYVNGQKIDTVSHSTYTQGYVGLFAANDTMPNGADVIFDNFEMSPIE